MQNRHIAAISLLCSASVFLTLPLGGCSSASTYTPRATNFTQADRAPLSYERAFRRGDYDEAARLASQAPRRDERARLIEGMARAQLDESDRAGTLLRPLLQSTDLEVRGRAAATLGLIEQQRGNQAEAARLLDIAAELLRGSDGDWAARYASNARAGRNGPSTTANTNYPSTDGGDYEIQFGSFSTQARAQRHAQAVSRITRSTGLTTPRVESVQRGARTLYAVRAGSFGTRLEAADAASRLDTDTAVVRTN